MQMWGRTSAKVVIPDCLFFISWICTGTQNLQHHVRRCVCVYIYTHMCKRLYLQSQCVVHPCESRFVGHLLKERLFGRGYSRSALASVSRADFDCTTFHRGLLNLRWRICFAGPECPEHGSWACTRTFRHRCVCEHGSTGGQSPCFPLTCPCWISNELQKNNFSMFFFASRVWGQFNVSSWLKPFLFKDPGTYIRSQRLAFQVAGCVEACQFELLQEGKGTVHFSTLLHTAACKQ